LIQHRAEGWVLYRPVADNQLEIPATRYRPSTNNHQLTTTRVPVRACRTSARNPRYRCHPWFNLRLDREEITTDFANYTDSSEARLIQPRAEGWALSLPVADNQLEIPSTNHRPPTNNRQLTTTRVPVRACRTSARNPWYRCHPWFNLGLDWEGRTTDFANYTDRTEARLIQHRAEGWVLYRPVADNQLETPATVHRLTTTNHQLTTTN